MSSPGTTSLADLPCIPMENEPVQLKTTEANIKVDNEAARLQQQREKDTIDMNTLVTGIQGAASSGALGLPQRDIPQSQDHLTQDQEVRANYIPGATEDYIGQGPSTEDIMRQHNEKKRARQSTDDTFDMLQVPITLALLFFAFQMPVVRKLAFDKLPFLFNKDGNTSIVGAAITSIAFSAAYVGISQSLDYLSA